MRRLLLLLALLALPALAAERVEEIASRPGMAIRTLVAEPEGPVRGAVLLLAGGDGHLGLTEGGEVTWLAGNQLVRSRARWLEAGWITAVPDAARDMPSGNRQMHYRATEAHAEDLAAVLAWLRQRTPRVVVVGTSAGAISAGNIAARGTGPSRPDALVITSGMVMPSSRPLPSVAGNIPGLERITMPVLLLNHASDGCELTPPDGAPRFAALLTGAPRVDIRELSGGGGRGNPCEGASAHGFRGLDAEVLAVLTEWLAANP